MGGGKFRARIALALAVSSLVIGVGRRSAGHGVRNVVNGVRGAHAARARHRRALRTRGAGIPGPRRAAPVEHRTTRAA
ncbi:hypothetical protein [Nocardia arthritidis]|uniref:hypothetical protein n=1 Tax=Nocardia arthritidis TaxID=228602 RepID=UPI0007A4EC87|nr:hypothetical protein [Nocardia arthritidis]